MKPSHQVLIVDGNPNDVQVVRKTLEDAGLAIHVRTDGSSAIEAFHTIKPDVVLIDVQVPETDGVRVSRELKQTDLGRSTPIILMSRRTLKAKERKHALSASGCALLLQKPVSSKQILETLSTLLPNAFVPRTEGIADPEEASSGTDIAPPDMVGIQAAPHGEEAPLLDPEALNDDVLGALFDQVFPTSDAGDLAGAIAAKTRTAEDPDPAPGKTQGPGAEASGARPRRRPAFDANEDSLSALLDEAFPTPTSASQGSGADAAPSVDAEIVDRPGSGESSRGMGDSDRSAEGAVLDGEVVATFVTPSPQADTMASSVVSTPAEISPSGSIGGSPDASQKDAPADTIEIEIAAADTPKSSPPDEAPVEAAPKGSRPAKVEVVAPSPGHAAGTRQDGRGRGKKAKGHRRDHSPSPHTESVQSIPLSAAPSEPQTPTPAESHSFMPDDEDAVIRTSPVVRPTSEAPTMDTKPASRAGRILTILFFLLAAATILYILLHRQGDQDLRPASRTHPQGSQSARTLRAVALSPTKSAGVVLLPIVEPTGRDLSVARS